MLLDRQKEEILQMSMAMESVTMQKWSVPMWMKSKMKFVITIVQITFVDVRMGKIL